MKMHYSWIKKEDITACKEVARAIIKRDIRKGKEPNAESIEYTVCSMFDCMNMDFRCDFEKWIKIEVEKINKKSNLKITNNRNGEKCYGEDSF